jgi:uncharacterized repeat protein (TIGR02543 family)
MRKRILTFIMVMLMIFTALPISASASTLYYGKTINSGETYTDTSFEMWCWYGNETFTNNGTVNISNGFTLGYQASFVNNSEFTFTGSNSTFGVSSGCSFQNNGTARISGCYNLGLEDSFVNTGTLYLSDISNFNVSGVVNTGKIVCGNGVPDRLIGALKEKSSGDGTVVKEGETTPSTSTRYTITYDLNGGHWENTPDESIYSYYYKTNDATPYYKIGFDEPFDTLNSNLERENYDFIGWTCDKDSSQTPSKYLDIMTNWQSNITLTAHWQPKQQYVYYYLDGGVFSDDITTPEIIKHESGISYSLFNIESDDFTLPTPTKPGYSFIGWKAGGTSDVYPAVTITKGTVGNQTYTAKWEANGNTPYTVNIYYMDKNGQYQETPDRTKPEIGATDTIATVPDSAYIKNGFSFDATKSSNSGTITGDGKLKLSLYYARNQYDITFKSYDGSETLYSYKGYYDTKIEFKGDEPAIKDEDYNYTFTGWSTNKNSQHPLSLGTIVENQTFYAAFEKEATFCLVNFVNTTGFAPLENTTYKLKKGEDFNINLYLANEKYYVGTEQWGLTFEEMFVAGDDGKGLKPGTDFTYSFDGYGNPVVFSIPNVTKDLNITFKACYHETHDYNPEFDVIKENATCSKEGEVLRTCYKCGKVVSEITSIAPDNHAGLKHIDAVAATKTAEGNIEYWYCEGCGKYYKDAKATQEITKAQTVTAKLPSDNNENTGGNDSNNNKPGNGANTLPQTGDNSSLALWIALLLANGGAVTATTVCSRKKKCCN